jgi:hypothetical protein
LTKCTIIALFCFAFQVAFGQVNQHCIAGSWVCLKVEDADGKPSSGPFGEADEYLRFTFAKKSLSISEAPFDTGLTMPIIIEGNYVKVFSEQLYNLPELEFQVQAVSKAELILLCTAKEKTVRYTFSNQQLYVGKKQHVIDCGLIIISEAFISTSDRPMYSIKNFDYQISNMSNTLAPCPIFKHGTYANLGSYLSLNFKFPRSFKSEKLSEEIVIQIQIGTNAIEHCEIIQGLDFELNSAIFELVANTTNKWIPLKIERQVVPVSLRFHFRFIQTFFK